MSIENFWQLLAGLGIFLYGMLQLEVALKELAGRTFKLFLKKHTSNKFSAILSGTVVTGVLQSSSVVTFIVLSFVGAGVITMRNALAVVFGSNLGTTLGSWVVAALGFKFNIEAFALPIIAVAAFGLIVFANRKKLYHYSKFAMGFGLLFLGLSFMKESIESLVKDFDFTPYLHYNRIVFVLLGFIITAIIQSSSATMVITLSALNSGVIPFETATGIVIGSELGTSIKVLFGSIGGIAAKRSVAFGNIFFNFVITVFAFFLMHPIISLIKMTGVSDPLINLVMFQSVINLLGILIFLPFLNRFGDFLENRFSKKAHSATFYIQDVSPQVPEAALLALEKETGLFILRVIRLNSEAFRLENLPIENNHNLDALLENNKIKLNKYNEKYDNVKQAEGEILSLYTQIIASDVDQKDLVRLNQLISSVRNAMYSAKGIKDIRHDRREMREAVVEIQFEQYKFLQDQLREFFIKLLNLILDKEKPDTYETLISLMQNIQDDYEVRMQLAYKQSAERAMNELDISTQLNVSREIYSSSKAIIFSLRDYLFDAAKVEEFDNKITTLL